MSTLFHTWRFCHVLWDFTLYFVVKPSEFIVPTDLSMFFNQCCNIEGQSRETVCMLSYL